MMAIAKAVVLLGFIFNYANGDRSFTVDKTNNCFLKDGQPFRYVSGSLHYFRIPQQYWKDRMLKMRAAGLNALQMYVEWSGHEPEPGQYNFEGNYDLMTFLRTAQEVGLLVVFRPGPYICAERDMGGFPYWLMRDNPNIQLRTMDPSYITPVDRWMKYLLNMIQPMLYKNGGNIILVQVENEYGQHDRCDKTYMAHLRDLSWAILGNDTILFRTDMPIDSFYKCDLADGLMVTADFGSGSDVTQSFSTMNKFNGGGPSVVTEYYPGWMDHWGQGHANVSADAIMKTFEEVLIANGSLNFYMFHGGTNFGFTSGANAPFEPQPTSYDYGAPLSEAGDPTPLYTRIRDVVGKYLPLPPGPAPVPSPKLALQQPLDLVFSGSLISLMPYLGSTVYSQYPKSFEELSIAYGFVIYSTLVPFLTRDPALLKVPKIGDRAYVLLDKKLVGVLSRQQNILSMPILIQKDQILTLVVENQGRINYGEETYDPKGLVSNVTLDGVVLTNWVMNPLPLNGTNQTILSRATENLQDCGSQVPGFFSVNFTLPKDVQPLDTFLDPSGWTKGVAFLNGFNLGRYWPVMGPQITLYVPGVLLKPNPEVNTLTLLELESAPCDVGRTSLRGTSCQVKLVNTPSIAGPVP